MTVTCIVEPPRIAKGTIHIFKIVPTANKAAANIGRRHVMAAFAHAGGNAFECNLRRFEPQIDQLDPIAAGFPRFDAVNVSQAAECGLEGEVATRRREPIELGEKKTSGVQCREGGLQW